MKEQNILREEWDNLIVLDACRYDTFKKIYDKYISGNLEKKDSKAGATPEWLLKNFNKKLLVDTTYFSANPYINSSSVSLQDIVGDDFPDWNPTQKFGQIIDVWKKFDQKFNTVMPKTVVKSVVQSPCLRRKIIHFIQPHLPFIHPEFKNDYKWNIKNKMSENKSKSKDSHNSLPCKSYIVSFLHKIFGKPIFNDPVKRWKLRKFYVPLESTDKYERIFRNGQLERVLEFYQYSLEKTLESITELIPYLEGKTVITADHGECFGEYNLWGHENFNHNPILTTVPWLEI